MVAFTFLGHMRLVCINFSLHVKLKLSTGALSVARWPFL